MSYTVTDKITNYSDVKYTSWEDFFENGLYMNKTKSDVYAEQSAQIQEALSEDDWIKFDDITKNAVINIDWDIDNQVVNTNLKDIGSRSRGNERNNKKNKKTVETKRQNLPISYIPPTLVPYVLYFDTNLLKTNAWQTLIFNSKGYEAMMCLSNYCDKNEGHTSEERQNFKEVFFGNLFYNKYQPKLTHLEEVFSRYFPNEFKALRSAKYKYGNKLLAVKVQSLEAKFFHKIAVNHLNRNYKHVPFVIKHDSIKVPIEYGFVIHDDLNKLAQSFFGRNDIKLKLETL